MVQTMIVALIVAGCALYAAWSLAPRGVRRVVALWLLARPLPRAVTARFRRHAASAGACGCDGCDRSPSARTTAKSEARAPSVAPQPMPVREVAIVFQPRRR